mgnify:CR=1 FL=1
MKKVILAGLLCGSIGIANAADVRTDVPRQEFCNRYGTFVYSVYDILKNTDPDIDRLYQAISRTEYATESVSTAEQNRRVRQLVVAAELAKTLPPGMKKANVIAGATEFCYSVDLPKYYMLYKK